MHAKYVASTQQPLDFVDDPAFEEYIQNAYNWQYRRVSRNSIRANCIKVFCEIRQSLINEFSRSTKIVAYTFDIWSGRTKIDYLCVTTHYVDKN